MEELKQVVDIIRKYSRELAERVEKIARLYERSELDEDDIFFYIYGIVTRVPITSAEDAQIRMILEDLKKKKKPRPVERPPEKPPPSPIEIIKKYWTNALYLFEQELLKRGYSLEEHHMAYVSEFVVGKCNDRYNYVASHVPPEQWDIDVLHVYNECVAFRTTAPILRIYSLDPKTKKYVATTIAPVARKPTPRR
jgi:hypothetical protein